MTSEDFKKELDKLTHLFMLSGKGEEDGDDLVHRIYDAVDITLVKALENIVLCFRLSKSRDDKDAVKKEEVLDFISGVVASTLSKIDKKLVGVVDKALKTKDDAEEVMNENKQER